MAKGVPGPAPREPTRGAARRPARPIPVREQRRLLLALAITAVVAVLAVARDAEGQSGGTWTFTPLPTYHPFPHRVPACSYTYYRTGLVHEWARDMGGSAGGLPYKRVVYPKGHDKCNPATGEPHLETFDGVRYDLQAAGEFVAAEAGDGDLAVQYRLEPWGDSERVSVVTGAAARVAGRRVTIQKGREAPLWVDGEPVTLESYQGFTLAEDAAVLREGRRYSIVWPDGTNLHVDVRSGNLDVFLLASPSREGRLRGIAGDADGDPENDFVTRDGRRLPAPPEFATIHRTFAESWRVEPGESLFDYADGEGPESYAAPDFPRAQAAVDDLSPEERRRAAEVCREAGVHPADRFAFESCLVDVGLTGDASFARAAAEYQTPERWRPGEPVRPPTPQPVSLGSCELAPGEPVSAGRAGSARTGRTGPGPDVFDGEEVWVAEPSEGRSGAAVVAGDLVFVRRRGELNVLEARSGEVRWERSVKGRTVTAPAVSGNAVYVTGGDALLALDAATGEPCWEIALPDVGGGGPAVARGQVYAGLSDLDGEGGAVAALHASTGEVQWIYPTREAPPSEPAVTGGTVFVGDGSRVLALDAEHGYVQWSATTGFLVDAPVAVDDATVYAADRNTGLHALDAATGEARWTWHEGQQGFLSGAPAVGRRLVYISDHDALHGIHRSTGRLAWSYGPERSRPGEPLVTATGVYALIGSVRGGVVALNPEDGSLIRRLDLGLDIRGAALAVAGGSVFLAPGDGTVRAYR